MQQNNYSVVLAELPARFYRVLRTFERTEFNCSVALVMHFVAIAAVALADDYDQCAMKDFIPGLELASKFYEEAVRPILESVFSGVPYSAVLIGAGSEVLGFDTEMPADHQSRAESDVVFGGERDYERQAGAITEALRQKLPLKFRGYPGHLLEAQSERQQRSTPTSGRARRANQSSRRGAQARGKLTFG